MRTAGYIISVIDVGFSSCLANKANLDDPDAELRSREDTEAFVSEYELGELWDDYGLIGDVIVS